MASPPAASIRRRAGRKHKALLELVQLPSMAGVCRVSFPAASNNASRSRARWRSSHRSYCSTSPFAALDKNLRLDMQIEVKRLQRVSGITTLIVTHDQEEALSMADRVAVLSQGRLEQFGSPSDVLRPSADPVREHVRRLDQPHAGHAGVSRSDRRESSARCRGRDHRPTSNEIDDGRWPRHRLHSARTFAVRH